MPADLYKVLGGPRKFFPPNPQQQSFQLPVHVAAKKRGHCNAGMTLTFGKSGKHRYQQVHDSVNKSNSHCPSRKLRVEVLDERVRTHIESVSSRIDDCEQSSAKHLQAELRKADDRLNRPAVETGQSAKKRCSGEFSEPRQEVNQF